MVPLFGSVVTFIVALLVGGLAIYIAAWLLVDVTDFPGAVFTAILGAIAWALTIWIPLIGPVIALVAWVGVIKWRYPGGWKQAIAMGIVAWAAALVILLILNSVLGMGLGAFGIPGV